MDRDLKLHKNIDCFFSGTTAVAVLKQVWLECYKPFFWWRTLFCGCIWVGNIHEAVCLYSYVLLCRGTIL
jgi:hypothetical protein